MSDARYVRWLIAAAVVGGAVATGCVEPNLGDDLAAQPDPLAKDTPDDDERPAEIELDAPQQGPDLEGKPRDTRCTDECTEGQKRCSTTSLSGTEVCKMGEGGCRNWTPGADCDASSSCDKIKNDGTCQAGCSNDAGCSASNVGVAHCTVDGTTELTCTHVGACYVFKTTRSNVPQDCVSPTYCGSASGRRISCKASAAGACTQHVAVYNDCPAGTACTGAGVCTATTTSGSCYSNTLGKTMPEGSCVLSAGDGVKEQCHDGLWYRGVSGMMGPYGACK